MGLKQVHFVDWIQLRFPAAVKPIRISENAKFDSVFIDVNCILHPAVRSAKSEADFVKHLFMTFDKLLRQCVPVRCCYLSVDSSAPFAKLALQKDRRRTKGSKTKSGRMSTLQITPGCPFMVRVEQYLDYYAVRYLQQQQGRGVSPDLKFIIDHGNNPGEGECKIIENIIQQKENIRGRSCALISLDSDTILQALALGMPNMYVVRKEKTKQHIAISIDQLTRHLEEQFPGGSARARLDFCAICMMRGNDYLRGMPVGIDRLWNSYIFTKTKDTTLATENAWLLDTKNKCFDLVFLRQFMKNTIKMPKTPNRKAPNKSANLLKDATARVAAVAIAAGGEDEDAESETDTSSDVSDSDSDTQCDTSMVEDDDDEETPQDPFKGGSTRRFSVERYLRALLWNIEFYSSGVCPDVTFVYDFQVAPKPADIIAFINDIEGTKSAAALQPAMNKKFLGVPTSKEDYPSPLVCAVMVTPLDSGAKHLPASVAGIHSAVDEKGGLFQPGRIEEIDKDVGDLIAKLAQSQDPKSRQEASRLQALYQKQSPHLWTRIRPGIHRRSIKPLPNTPISVVAFKHETSTGAPLATQDHAMSASPGSTTIPASPPPTGASSHQSRKFMALLQQPDIVCLGSQLSPATLALKDVKPLKRFPWVDAKQAAIVNPTWPFLWGGRNNPRASPVAKRFPAMPSAPSRTGASSGAGGANESASMSGSVSSNSSDWTTVNRSGKDRRRERPTKPSGLSKEAFAAPRIEEQVQRTTSGQDHPSTSTTNDFPIPAHLQHPPPEETKVDLVAMLHASMEKFQQQSRMDPTGSTQPPSSHQFVEPATKAPSKSVKKPTPLPHIQTNNSLKAFMPLSVQSSLAAQRAKGSKQPQGR